MRRFLEELRTTGEVSVPAGGEAFEIGESLEPEIRQFDQSARRALAGEAPALDLVVAEWAARLLAEAARAAIAREMEPAKIAAVFAQPCPRPHSPETDYSADLFLRYLPDLLAWLQRLAAEDPLVTEIRRICGAWPLSSVGVKDLPLGSIEPFIGPAALRQLYVDRILARKDFSRIGDARVADGLRAALGAYPELCPEMAERISLQPTDRTAGR